MLIQKPKRKQPQTNVKIMAIASWYATKYNAIVGQVPRTTPVKFLKMWAYRLVSRADVPMIQVDVCMCTYIIYTCIYIYKYVNMYIYISLSKQIHTYICIYVYEYWCVCKSKIYTYICIYVYICTYTYIG